MPIRRVTIRSAALLCLILAAATAASGTRAGTNPHRELARASRSQMAVVADLRRLIDSSRKAAWHWQDLAGDPRSKTNYGERRVIGVPYLKWLDHLWQHRWYASRHYVRNLLSSRGYLPPSKARQLGRVMAAAGYGWTGPQWRCLDELWGHRESGWYVKSDNPSSGAYGIPQSYPGSKMASAGRNWLISAYTQIKWGLRYIAGHRPQFSTPCQAISWHNIHHSY